MEGEKPSWILLDSQLVTPGLIFRDVARLDRLTKRRVFIRRADALASGLHVLRPLRLLQVNMIDSVEGKVV